MRIQNSRKWSGFSPIEAHIIALVVLFGTYMLRRELAPILGQAFPYQFFQVGSIAVCFFLGIWPATSFLLIGAVVGNYYFVPPYGEFTPLGGNDLIYLTNYFVTGAVALFVLERLQRAKYETELLLKVSESRYDLFLDRENSRTSIERRLRLMLDKQVDKSWRTPSRMWLAISEEGHYLVNNQRFREGGLTADSPQDWKDLIPAGCRADFAAAVANTFATGKTVAVNLWMPGAEADGNTVMCTRAGDTGSYVVYLMDAEREPFVK